ncbi:MAG: DUF2330 domain-containing protein [Myxococcota bacterium]
MMRHTLTGATLSVLLALSAPDASAFCGFYVGGAGAKMFNNATQVVLLREGTTTVLSMQNNYQGPTEDFAMVVPVPVVLEEDHVNVLKDEAFTKIDKLGAPRLVEYFEDDPCNTIPYYGLGAVGSGRGGAGRIGKFGAMAPKELVKVEAEFDVGEYNVVILSAKESNALESWLVSNEYNIPEGAAGVLKGYIEAGQYFFVAKVDVEKVAFTDGKATLSPLRFHYDSKDFSLPVRLGLLNADGAQDLIVNILASNQRYEVANLKNVTIPTNLFVDKSVKKSFAQFYVTLFDHVTEDHPGSVVTEYAWQATKCDPCPDGSFGTGVGLTGALTERDLEAFGGDVLGPKKPAMSTWVLTRLHARYTADQLKEDLVFKEASPIVGGRGTPSGFPAKMEQDGAKEASFNNFQGRYIVLHPWEKDMTCKDPQRGRWGEPPPGVESKTGSAQDTASAKRGGVVLANVVLPASHALANITGADATETNPAVKPKDGDEVAQDEAEGTQKKDARTSTPKEATKENGALDKKSQCTHASAGGSEVPSGLFVVAFGVLVGVRVRMRTCSA